MQQIPLIKNKISFDDSKNIGKYNPRENQSDNGSHASRKGIIKFEVEKGNKKHDKDDEFE